MSFNIGDRVRLKSGGVTMTVERLDPDGTYIECVWHEKVKGRTTTGRDTYHKDTLEIAPKPASGIGVLQI
ncbi:MAG: YodC family protein [Methylovirgula sp.]